MLSKPIPRPENPKLVATAQPGCFVLEYTLGDLKDGGFTVRLPVDLWRTTPDDDDVEMMGTAWKWL